VMAPNALRPIEEMIPIIYPGVRLFYGKVQGIAAEAEAQAAAFNAKADLAGVRAGALDELFSQGEPVLAGVDLDHGYLFSLALRETRGGEDWAEVLKQGQEQGLNLAVVVKDAAQGIEAGVRQVFPPAEQRADCFHARYELTKATARATGLQCPCRRRRSPPSVAEDLHKRPSTTAVPTPPNRSCPPPLPRGYRPV
jgi:hypothetical protein